jgi:signal transduction histidine kinase
MKSSFRSADGYFRCVEFFLGLILPILWLFLAVVALPLQAVEDTNALEIRSVAVNGKSLPLRGKESISLGAFPENIIFSFGPETNAIKPPPLRLSYTLEGYDNSWHENVAEMGLTIRFYNGAGDQIGQNIYRINGESTGWTGSLKSSSLTHRRETLVVPPQATRLLVVISSAGPPDTVGIYVVANLAVSKSSGSLGNVVLLQSPFDNDHDDRAAEELPVGWMHDGTRPSMAKVIKFGQEPQTKAFAILDEDQSSHGEWHNILESAPAVTPGDSLVVEWNEMYSMGLANFHEAIYASLPAGYYKFRVRGLNVMGMQTGDDASVNIFVAQPLWKTSWFWSIAAIAIAALIIGISRYFVWHKMRREMVRLKEQRALEQERLRIAHDIHDDLGARVTQISLVSAMAEENASFPEKARADFDKISKMSRELVSALYETVWAVNPENDNLDALGNYLCQMVKQLCEQTPLRCRFHVLDLPHEVQVSSQTRHNISLAVKEAVHNIIKHAKATEVTIRMVFTDGVLDVSINDDGSGFQTVETISGHGLSNMKQRLQNIGGRCFVESNPGHGTTVRMNLRIQPSKQGS